MQVRLQTGYVSRISEKGETKRKKAHNGADSLVSSADSGFAKIVKHITKKGLVSFCYDVVFIQIL